MSELRSLDFEALVSSGFRTDLRFAGDAERPPHPVPPEAEPQDPLAIAWADGFAAGSEKAQGAAALELESERAARERLELSVTRLDVRTQEELRLRLRDTVAALCEAALKPMALDEEALMRRIDKAVSMLARADDDRVIRLHPDDLALIGPRLAAEWDVQADPALERGALRVESGNGGVEDGPEQWRRAIAEAFHQC